MNNKELFKNIEGLVEQLATTPTFSKDPHQLLREALFQEAWNILSHELTDEIAYECADQMLADARQELRERQKKAKEAAKLAAAHPTNTEPKEPRNTL